MPSTPDQAEQFAKQFHLRQTQPRAPHPVPAPKPPRRAAPREKKVRVPQREVRVSDILSLTRFRYVLIGAAANACPMPAINLYLRYCPLAAFQ